MSSKKKERDAKKTARPARPSRPSVNSGTTGSGSVSVKKAEGTTSKKADRPAVKKRAKTGAKPVRTLSIPKTNGKPEAPAKTPVRTDASAGKRPAPRREPDMSRSARRGAAPEAKRTNAVPGKNASAPNRMDRSPVGGRTGVASAKRPPAKTAARPAGKPVKKPENTAKKKTKVKAKDKAGEKARKRHLGEIGARAILFGILLVIMAALSVLFLFAGLNIRAGNGHGDIVYYIGSEDKENAKRIVLASKDAWHADEKYIRLDDLDDLCKFSVTGDDSELRYITRDTKGQAIRFDIGQRNATVNGMTVRLPAECILKSDGLYVPLDFVKAYIGGLTVKEENNGSVVYVFNSQKPVDGSKRKTDKEITFSLSDSDPLEKIPKDDETLEPYIYDPKREKPKTTDTDKDNTAVTGNDDKNTTEDASGGGEDAENDADD